MANHGSFPPSRSSYEAAQPHVAYVPTRAIHRNVISVRLRLSLPLCAIHPTSRKCQVCFTWLSSVFQGKAHKPVPIATTLACICESKTHVLPHISLVIALQPLHSYTGCTCATLHWPNTETLQFRSTQTCAFLCCVIAPFATQDLAVAVCFLVHS